MKRRLPLLAAFLVFAVSLCISLFPMSASAAADYFYTDDNSHDGIQGPNPYATGDNPQNVTYHKTNSTDKGLYVAINAGHADNSGKNFCYPAIQTDDKKYDGDKNGKLFLDCGYPDSTNLQSGKGAISIGQASNNQFQQQQSQSQCQGKTGQDLQACTAGYTGGANGQSEAQACQGFTGANLTTCQDAWDAAQGNGDDSATCENKGGPLAWILCPIFNEMSDASQWLFQNIVQPFLITAPISTDPSDPSFQIWSNLRVYGDIFLVIALLVIVFGESIGGGLIDAYTAKKVLPRLLVAAVLINLSIYIVAFLVDVSNILGAGIGNLLTAPISHCSAGGGGNNCWDFTLTTGDQARVFSIGLIGFLASSTALAGFVGALVFGSVGTVITAAFFVMLPIFFAILAVFITLILRKGLILLLVLVSPVAFALYCLPNTERFFKRWWDLLIEALMVYPIIVAIFGVAEILSITILTANGISSGDLTGGAGQNVLSGNLNRSLALLVAFLLQFLPLLAVPFAFRFASGALGRIYEAATGAGTRINQLAEGRREHAKRDFQAEAVSSRARMYHAGRDFGDKTKIPGGRFVGRTFGKLAGGYNIEALASAVNAQENKIGEEQIATGRDEEIRGLMVNKKRAKTQKQAYWNKALNGGDGGWAVSENGRALRDEEIPEYGYGVKDGQTFYQSDGGAWISEGDVDAGHSRWGSNRFMQQTALGYEMRKALTDGQRARLTDQYFDTASGDGGWGMTKGEASGAWVGASFANQATSLQYKYTKSEINPNTGKRSFDYNGYIDEIYEKRNSSAMSQMDAGSIDKLTEAWKQSAGNEAARGKLQSIAQTMEYGMRGAQQGETTLSQADDGGAAGPQAIPYGAGHVTDSMRNFITEVRRDDNTTPSAQPPAQQG